MPQGPPNAVFASPEQPLRSGDVPREDAANLLFQGLVLGPVPDPEETVRAYLDAWKADDYASMYNMLTTISQDAITETHFTNWYTSVAKETALNGVEYDILGAFVQSTRSAQASYRVNLQSVLIDDIIRDTVMNLSLEDGEWRVQWADNLIIPELAGGNYLWMEGETKIGVGVHTEELPPPLFIYRLLFHHIYSFVFTNSLTFLTARLIICLHSVPRY